MTDRDWAWRRRIRSNPQTRAVYRVVVGVLGALVVCLGLVLVPFPGPGWLIVFMGVLVWATEFTWAKRLHTWGMGVLRRWNDWVMAQAVWVRGLLGLATAAFVGLVVLAMIWLTGIPGWLPEMAQTPLREYLPDGPWRSR